MKRKTMKVNKDRTLESWEESNQFIINNSNRLTKESLDELEFPDKDEEYEF